MAISLVQTMIGSALRAAGGTTGAGTFPLNLTAGNAIIIGINPVAGTLVGNPTDTQGNTYTKIGSLIYNTNWVANLFYAQNIHAGTNIISMNFAGTNGAAFMAREYSGLVVSSVFDVAGSAGTSAAGTVINFGTTPTTTQGSELVVGVGFLPTSASSITIDASYGNLGSSIQNLGDTVFMMDKVISSTGTQGGIGTFLTSHSWAGFIATFKAISSPAGTNLIQSSGTSLLAASAGTVAFPSNTTAGDLIVVGVSLSNTGTLGTVSSITDNQNNTYTRALMGTKSSGIVSVLDSEIWYAKNIVGGAGTVTVNHTADNAAIYIREYSGYNTLDATGSAVGSSATPNTGTLNTNFGSELIIVSSTDDNIGGGQTYTAAGTYGDMVGTTTTLTGIGMEDALQNGTAAQTGTLTLGNSSDWVALMATFYQSTGAASPGFKSLLGVGQM